MSISKRSAEQDNSRIDNTAISSAPNNTKNTLSTNEDEKLCITNILLKASEYKSKTRDERIATATLMTKIIYSGFNRDNLSPQIAKFISSIEGQEMIKHIEQQFEWQLKSR